tara:strand:+ start:1693 stop:2169 length:477 start_codon:yes stop_codon:yes gene_type:complete
MIEAASQHIRAHDYVSHTYWARRMASRNQYRIAFHLIKKSCEKFPDEAMIQIEYWDDKYIEPVYNFFSQNQSLIPRNIIMSFEECMPLLECNKKQNQFTTLSASSNSLKKRKIEESRVSPTTVTRTIYSPDLALQESYSSTSTLRDTADKSGLDGIFF